jgi:glucose-1-phosphate thymidylyltransferase
MLGIIPAAGAGTRIQPLAFSKELLPVGTRIDGGTERPRAVSEYLCERLVAAGADRICFVISPGKGDILSYYGGEVEGVPVCYAVQQRPSGLCDAIFRALPFAHDHETAAVGLPDTVWFPSTGLRELPDDVLSFLLFPVRSPQLFDAVVMDDAGRVLDIQVKSNAPTSSWIWGAFKAPVRVLEELRQLWEARDRQDQYIGTLVNQYLAAGGQAVGVRAGVSYVDVGTLHGYREALALLQAMPAPMTTTGEVLHEPAR